MHSITIFIWFILYSTLGWIVETVYCSIKGLKWDNRGMLVGPYCPIYGVGAVLDVLLCSSLPNAAAVFFVCMAGSAVLEYFTSYMTERLFHAVWWDYSDIPLNLNGRICLPCSLSFGVAGLVVLYGIHPHILRLTRLIPLRIQEPAALLFMAVFAADCALTADSLAAINVKLDYVIATVNSQISERYDAFIENTKQNLSEGLDTLKEMIPLEEYREKRAMEELKNTASTMSWSQKHAVRSSVSFRRPLYSEYGSKLKQQLFFRRKEKKKDGGRRRRQ